LIFIYTYIHIGWEGSAHDGQVVQDALSKGLIRRPLMYYLGDAGYALTWWCLTPYRGVRYHLKEWALGNRKPQNPRELFNLRHSSLRNVIERVFGILKKRFSILTLMTSYSIEKQVKIVKSCFYLHNFIKLHQGYDDLYDEWDDNEADDAADDNEADDNEAGDDVPNGNFGGPAAWRDGIANDMWEQYQIYLQANPEH
jgi:hypothetical protein